ncbi:hypothetical protein I4U23_016325 [Adineta vaga]|nr:hypothetical protein I4U23_016325 [Adineta vaga]
MKDAQTTQSSTIPVQSSSTHNLCPDCRARDVVYFPPIYPGPGYSPILRTPAMVSLGYYVSSPSDYYARRHGYDYIRCNCVCHS